jgi:transcriptional regulator with XRE-family HTH domain
MTLPPPLDHTNRIEASKAATKNKRHPQSPVGEVLDGLLRGKGWSLRDLEAATRQDGQPGYISHQHICMIMRGKRNPGERMLNRLLKPFGYRAFMEIRFEPIAENKKKGELICQQT